MGARYSYLCIVFGFYVATIEVIVKKEKGVPESRLYRLLVDYVALVHSGERLAF